MDNTENLGLPYIMAAQAQKHVTHNEALRMLDGIVQLSVISEAIATPPATPDAGDRYIIPTGATDDWTDQVDRIAAWQDGAWAFLVPVEGWLSWVTATNKLKVYSGGQWQDVTTGGSGGGGNDPDPQFNSVGINASADPTNRLSISSVASLFNHAGNGHQIKINKAAVGDTASLLYQSAFSGRAEMGLAGSDDFSVKVSADGTNWHDALTIDGETGAIAHKTGARHSFGHDATDSGITISPGLGDPAAPQNGDIWYNSSLGKFRKHQDGATSDLDTSSGGGGGGGGTPGGANTQVQFNDGGAFAGAAFVSYNKATGDLGVEKTITIDNTTDATTGVIRKGTAPFIHAYGTNNLFFGGSSGNFTVTGSNNAVFGAFALTKVTTGQHNLAFGAQALNDVTTGIRNVSVGSSCLTDLIGGSYNIGVGASALQKDVSGSRNLGLGYQTLYNCDASDNISVGYRSGFNVSSGTYNIFIGRDAGGGIKTGGGNVVIGRQSGLSATLSNTIILATGGGTKRMEIDSNGHAAFEGAVRLKSHTVASLPSASIAGAGAMVFVSDKTGGAIPAFSDGTDWRRTSDRSVVA